MQISKMFFTKQNIYYRRASELLQHCAVFIIMPYFKLAITAFYNIYNGHCS